MKTNGRESRKSLAFTSQPKRNDSKSRRSVSSLNLDDSERNPNDALFDTLMNDPIKRTMIMKLLSQERGNIEKYKQIEDKKKATKLKRNERLLHCESPTALLRRRALEKNRRDSDSGSPTSDSRSTSSDSRSVSTTPVPFELLLRGVVAYVEIRSKEGDLSAGAKALMQAMGATVKDHFSADVTHVVFKDGSFTTYQKAKLKKVHLVSVLWLEAVRKNNFCVSEKNYPALGTEAFDVNISQICSDYEKVVNEETRRSRAIGLPSPFSGSLKSRKTALPSQLKSVLYDGGPIPSPTVAGRLSEFVIPTSQDWDAESVISCASGTLPFRRTTPTTQDEDSLRFAISTPELTSDNDSDCGVIDGHSFKRDSLELPELEKVQDEPELGNANTLCVPGPSGVNNISVNTSNNTSSTRSASLLSRKSAPNRKSSYQIVDMDLTNIENSNKENINLKARESAKKARGDSGLLSDSSLNLLDEAPATNLRQTRNKYDARRSTCKKSDLLALPPNDKIFKEPYVNVGNIGAKFHSTDDLSLANSGNKTSRSTRVTRSTNDLIGKGKHSVSSDETPSLRFSTSSKDTTDPKSYSRSVRTSDTRNGQKNPEKNTEEMPSFRISTSISSNDASNKRHSARISGNAVEPQGGQNRQSPHSDEMPSLRISSSGSANDSSGKRKSPNSTSGSLESDVMPSLRISSSSTDISERMKTRSSMCCQSTSSADGKNETKEARNSSDNNDGSEKKKRAISPTQIEPEGQKDQNREDTPPVKKKRGKFPPNIESEVPKDYDTPAAKKKRAKSPPNIETEAQTDQNREDTLAAKNKRGKFPPNIDSEAQKGQNREDTPAIKQKRGKFPPNIEPEAPKDDDTPAAKKKRAKSPPNIETEAQKDQNSEDTPAAKNKSGKFPPNIDSEAQKGQNREDTPAMKKKRKSDQQQSCNTEAAGAKKSKASRSRQIEVMEENQNHDGVQENAEKNNQRSLRSLRSRTSGYLISEETSNGMVQKPNPPKDQNLEDSTETGGGVPSSRRVREITPISENQTNSSCNGDEPSEETNQVDTWGSTRHSGSGESLDNEENLPGSACEFPNRSTRSLRSRNAHKEADLKSTSATSTRSSSSFKSNEVTPLDESVITSGLDSPKTCDAANNIPNNNDKAKKFRKLYNLNQSVEETLKNFEWDDNDKGEAPSTAAPNNVVAKKTVLVPLAPIPVTPMAKRLLEKNKPKKTLAKKEKVPKKDPPPPKKMCLDSSKDEQKQLAEEYVNARKINTDGETQPENKRPARISRRSQRLSQCQKRDYAEVSDSDGEEPIAPKVRRRSTFDFVQASSTKTQKAKKKKKKSSIVCTRMHRPDVQTFGQVVRKLGCFFVQDEVTDKTTHLVVGEPKRTINLLKALARGCWILKQEWLFRSLEADKWLPEEDFEVTDFSPAVQQCRTERRAFGSLYSMDIFENCGPIYVARSSIPRRSDLQELVQLCKGTLTNIALNASVVVGEWVRYEHVKCVTEKWILDSITFNKRKSFKNYFIKRGR